MMIDRAKSYATNKKDDSRLLVEESDMSVKMTRDR